MRTTHGSPFAAAAVVVAAALAAQDGPRRVMRPESIAKVRGELGHEPFAILAAWSRDELADGMERFFEGRPDALTAAYHEAVVCGLWSDDPDVAFGAACHVPERMLDLRDIDRYVAITMPRLSDEDLRFDWDTFKHVVSTRQVARVIEARPDPRSDVRQLFLQDLHRSMRPVHIPALCARVRDRDPVVRQNAFRVLANLSIYTDRHREDLALMLLDWPGYAAFELVDYDDPTTNPPYEPRAIELPADGGGYPALLHAALARWFVELGPSRDLARFDAMLMRWAADETPNGDDRALLLALLEAPQQAARWIALGGLRALAGDARARDAVAAFAARPDIGPAERAVALAACGDVAALRARAAHDGPALLAALELGDEPAWVAWQRRARSADAARGLAAVELLGRAHDAGRYAPIPVPSDFYARIREFVDAHAPELDAARLALIARELPSCRTRRLADAYLEKLRPSELESCVASMLELHDAQGFETRLIAWARDGNDAYRVAALDLLARLGAPECGQDLVDHARADPERTFLLARSGGAEVVRRYLRELVGAIDPGGEADFTPFTALAAAHGLPESTCRAWTDALAETRVDLLRPAWARWTRDLADAPVDVLADFLAVTANEPDPWFACLGLVDDDRVRAHLRRLRDTPGAPVQDVIAELAVLGEPDAIADMREVRARHLYGWMDDGSQTVRTLADRLDVLPYWIGEVETVCCRRNVAAGAIEELTGFDVYAMSETGMRTQHAHANAWWQRVGPYLRWSRIAGRYDVAPH